MLYKSLFTLLFKTLNKGIMELAPLCIARLLLINCVNSNGKTIINSINTIMDEKYLKLMNSYAVLKIYYLRKQSEGLVGPL